MMQTSLWQKIKLPSYDCLKENITTDVLVIGGGLCGILCAYRLSKMNVKVVLVEKETLACSRTNKTTAVITALQDICYSDLIEKKGKQAALQYLNACLEAIEEYRTLARSFDFDFESVPSYKYFKGDPIGLKKEVEAISALGYDVVVEDGEVIKFANQAQMNPLKLIQALIPYFTIYEHTEVLQIKNNKAYTEQHTIQAKQIIVATGYPFLKLQGLYPLKLTQKKSYVLVVENANPNQSFNAIGSLPENLYFRTYHHDLIVGGNDQKTGGYKGGFHQLLQYVLKNYPNHRISYQWVNQDCVSLDGLPYIGAYKGDTFVATGFNLWGMSGSMLAAMILTDFILGQKNPYASLFDPNRPVPVFPLIKNVGIAVWNLIKPQKRCTHLGCALYYNKEEHAYECPCHGTKYDSEGNVVFNPATKPKK